MRGQDNHSQDEEMRSASEYGRRAEPLPDIHVHSVLTAGDAEYGEELRDRRARQEHLERETTSLGKRLSAPLASETSQRRGFLSRFRRSANNSV